MKQGIHPEYHQASVTCTCGNAYTVGSTLSEMKLDLCSACHPFFTGKQKFVDTAGRVDKYFQKYGEEAQKKFTKKKKKRILSDEEVAALETASEDEAAENIGDEAQETAEATTETTEA